MLSFAICAVFAETNANVAAVEQVYNIWPSVLQTKRRDGVVDVFVYGALVNKTTVEQRGMTLLQSELARLDGYRLVVSNGFFGVVPDSSRSINGVLMKVRNFLPEPTYNLEYARVVGIETRTNTTALVHVVTNYVPPHTISARYRTILQAAAREASAQDHFREQLSIPVRPSMDVPDKIPYPLPWQQMTLSDVSRPLLIGINGKLYDFTCDASSPVFDRIRRDVVHNGFLFDYSILFSLWRVIDLDRETSVRVKDVVHYLDQTEKQIYEEFSYGLSCWDVRNPIGLFEYTPWLDYEIRSMYKSLFEELG